MTVRRRANGPRERLQRCISTTRGISEKEALNRAEAKVVVLKDVALASVDKDVNKLWERFNATVGRLTRLDLLEFQSLANSVAAIAGQFDRPGVGAASRSLCQTIDGQLLTGRIDMPQIQVHVAAIRLLNTSPRMADVDVAPLMDGLARVREKASSKIAESEDDDEEVEQEPRRAGSAA
ncbi:MAG: hypothetical protein U1E56_02990 [Bauldia sp.]